MSMIKNTTDKFWEGCEEQGILILCWRCKLLNHTKKQCVDSEKNTNKSTI